MDQTFEKRKKVIYDFIRDDLYVPMRVREIAAVLQIPREQREELKSVLDALWKKEKSLFPRGGNTAKIRRYRKKGIFQANVRGFGFVAPEEGGDDVFIPEEYAGGAFHGDEVEYIVTGNPGGKRREGKIVQILSHSVVKVVGLYEKNKNFGFVRPDNQRYLSDIYIPAGKEMGAMTGNKVVVELTSYGGERTKPEGKVVGDSGTCQ